MKAFETFSRKGLRFLAYPVDGGVYILDENGNGYGSFFSVDSFRNHKTEEVFTPICKVKLSKQHID